MGLTKQPPHSAGRRFNGLRAAIDPAQLPSVVTQLAEDQAVWSNESFLTCDTQRSIPLALSRVISIDQGNSSPRFIRATTYAFPYSAELAHATEVPLALVYQPFSEQPDEEEAIPVVDFGASGPPRCTGCRSYVNPWTVWTMGATRWVCNLCGAECLAESYSGHLGPNGRRTDLNDHPELRLGTVDFAVPTEYWATPEPVSVLRSVFRDVDRQYAEDIQPSVRRCPTPINIMFLLDVSQHSAASGMITEICNAIHGIVYEDGPQSPAQRKISIMAFDSQLYFYDLSPGFSQPRVLVIGDLEEPFIPFPTSAVFFDPWTSRDAVESVLSLIPRQFSHSTQNRRATFAALHAVYAVMLSTGGQVVWFNEGAPNYGSHISSTPEAPGSGSNNVDESLRSQDSAWHSLGKDMASAGIGVCLLSLPINKTDLRSLRELVSATGGDIFHHPNLTPSEAPVVLQSDIRRIWNRQTGFDVRIRVRASRGLRVTSHSGCYTQGISGDLVLGTIDADKALTVALEHDHTLDTRKDVFVQVAVLYTSSRGQRLVRTLNLAIGVASLAHNVFRYGDVDATTAFMVKEVIEQITYHKLNDSRKRLTSRCASLLLAYRRQCAAGTSPAQLILPEAYKLLPTYVLAFLKTSGIKEGNVTTDARNASIHFIQSSGVASLLAYIYPQMYPVHQLPSNFKQGDGIGFVPRMRLSYREMAADGAYLIDNNQNLTILWLGQGLSPTILQDLFQVGRLSDLSRNSQVIPGSPLADHFHAILSQIKSSRSGRHTQLLLARQESDASEIIFSDLLAEDENNGELSLVDYICEIHKLVNQALTSNSGIDGSFWSSWSG